uniref:Phospholipase D-like domain-containing protein n=1 Tax=Dechloromonas aromatica (strain RCB) TaxID=159087 RepID=Q47H93_DECAR
MSFLFLPQSPTKKFSTKQLGGLLTRSAGRIYLCTASTPWPTTQLSQEFSQILQWVAGGVERELIVLVGIFDQPGSIAVATQLQGVLANLYVNAMAPLVGKMAVLKPNVRFYAAEKWHAKAIAITGYGERFEKMEAAIFGSTNFSDSARHGSNYELDVYVDNQTDQDALILSNFSKAIHPLYREAMKKSKIKDFHKNIYVQISQLIQNIPAGLPTKAIPLPLKSTA